MDRRRARIATALLTLLPLAGAPALAGRLRLATGDWIETRGPWKIEGERVVYETPEGALRSLPLSELARPDAQPVRRPRRPGTPIREDPWGGVPEIPDPGPLPELPKPPLVRPRTPPPLPVCILANAEPGGDPFLVCERESGGSPPGAESPPADRGGFGKEMVARGRIELPTP